MGRQNHHGHFLMKIATVRVVAVVPSMRLSCESNLLRHWGITEKLDFCKKPMIARAVRVVGKIILFSKQEETSFSGFKVTSCSQRKLG